MFDRWHGISGVCVSVPTIVGRPGAGMNAETLGTASRAMHDSAGAIRASYDELGSDADIW